MMLSIIAKLYSRRIGLTTQEFFYNTKLKNLDVSVVVPVFNQEAVIVRNILSIINNLSLNAEVHIINDNSEDRTNQKLQEFLDHYSMPPENLAKISYYSFNKAQFETFSDHFAINRSVGRYIIEIQADMRIKEPDFDHKMIEILESNNDIFMLSGRGIMPFSEILSSFATTRGNEASVNTNLLKALLNLFVRRLKTRKVSEEKVGVESSLNEIDPDESLYAIEKKAGRLGRLIEDSSIYDQSVLYVGETVMRGPICFSRDRYNNLGGLNTKAFFLGFDEHDLNLRARLTKNWRAAYTHLAFESPLEDGAMRKKRSMRSRFDLYFAQVRTRNYVRKTQIYTSAFSPERLSFNDHEIRKIN